MTEWKKKVVQSCTLKLSLALLNNNTSLYISHSYRGTCYMWCVLQSLTTLANVEETDFSFLEKMEQLECLELGDCLHWTSKVCSYVWWYVGSISVLL